MNKTTSGLLVITDISGYTMFLSASELDHAQEILSALLNGLIDHTRPPFTISRTAGDAVISYAVGEATLTGQTFVELLEDMYVAFRRTIELMVLNNTCQCAACTNVSALDLNSSSTLGPLVCKPWATMSNWWAATSTSSTGC